MTRREFAEAIQAMGGRAYIVGGWVRDELRGVGANDMDYVVTGVSPEAFEHIFPRAFRTGNSFPVYRMEVDGAFSEVALARREVKDGTGYRGFKWFFSCDTTIRDDLFRRDTTVNSMALDLLTGERIDPFGGVADVANGVIRATSEHFTDDPVRALRAARQAAQFGFSIEPRTLGMMRACGGELAIEPKERLVGELSMALASPKPSVFFRSLLAADILSVAFPRIFALIGVAQPPEHHPEGDAFEHTMEAVDRASGLTDRTEIRFSALAHDIGKALTPAQELPRHRMHDLLGLDALGSWNRDMTLPRRWVSCAVFAIRQHMRARRIERPGRVVDMLNAARRHPIGLDGLETVIRADGRDLPEYLAHREKYLAAMDSVDANARPPELTGVAIGEWLRNRQIAAVRAQFKIN